MSGIAKTIEGHPDAKGLAIIISNDYANSKLKTLVGIHKDNEEMQKAFAKLNIATHFERNITGKRLRELIAEVLDYFKSNNPAKYCDQNGCVSFVFSGHGSTGDNLIGQDGEEVPLHQEIVKPLLDERGKDGKLGEMSKLFFIDACRGNGKYVPFYPPTPKAESKAESKAYTQAGNCMIAYATIPSFVSWMNQEGTGSAWMQVLAEELGKGNDSVQNLVSTVNGNLWEKYKKEEWLEAYDCYQQPCADVRLLKPLYLGRHSVVADTGEIEDPNDGKDVAVNIWKCIIHHMLNLWVYVQPKGSKNGRTSSRFLWCFAFPLIAIVAAGGVYWFWKVGIDECAIGTHRCDPNAICSDTKGSYTCSCSSGFQGDGFNCTSIDECAIGTHRCDPNAVCSDTKGSYTCSCSSGFQGDGFACTSNPPPPPKSITTEGMPVKGSSTLILSQRPTMKHLQLIKWGNEEKLMLIETIAAHWKKLGTTFGIPEQVLHGFETKKLKDQEECCRDVLRRWLESGSVPKESYPVNWEGLINALEDTGLDVIANDTRQMIDSIHAL